MPPTLRSRQVTPSKSTPSTADPDSPQDLSKSARDRRRSVRLASASTSASASKGKEDEEEEQHALEPYVSDSLGEDEDVDDDSTPRKKSKFGTGSPDHHDKGKAVATMMVDNDEGEICKILASRFSREDKGKGIMIMDAPVDLDLKLGVGVPGFKPEEQLPPALNPEPQVIRHSAPVRVPWDPLEERLKYSKKIAKQNAPKFARADSIERVEDEADIDPDPDPADREADLTEDWPGPFSTAMKIIRDRETRGSGQAQHFRLDNTGAPTVIWKPNPAREKDSSIQKKRMTPSLQDLSMQVLVNYSDALTSLEFVPDALRHKFVSMLCDARKMTADALHLIFQGSPSEICITDCSWIEEEQFKTSFEPCNTQNLVVLQLNQCGRCMPDYIVLETLANKGLPSLTTLSLKGACRLSDDGLKALISCAPAIKSLNLSQCSLITNAGVNSVADSLRSTLRELYLDDCQTLNVMLLIPSLEKLSNLEVLSLAGIPTVTDKFLRQLIGSIGRNIKELVLANCLKLTDSTLRVISKNCCQLCALDLVNVTKLTDAGIGCLASCCQAIQSLKLCGNTFSDEAIAAFVEACGESLKELSLNNVKQVGPHTSISIARRCKNLVELDVSWCRNLTDECLGLIADSCESLRMIKVFGCTQITSTFSAGHSNEELRVIGIQLTPILENPKKPDQLKGLLRYSAV